MKSKAELEFPYRGHLGRTARTSVLITSAAGPAFPAPVYTSVNVTANPELKEALFAGTLNEIECPYEKGRVYALAIPVVYHDEQARRLVLFLPEALRHEEFKRRCELLQELDRQPESLPNYVRNFDTVFSLAELEATTPAAQTTREPLPLTVVHETSMFGQATVEVPSEEDLEDYESALAKQFEERRQELEQQWQARDKELEETRDRLKVERDQLEEVASRMERDSARVEEAMSRLERERQELDALRKDLEEQHQGIEVERLNLEQERIRIAQGEPKNAAEESTQVVTDDQFLEVIPTNSEDEQEAQVVDEDDVLVSEVLDDLVNELDGEADVEFDYDIEEIAAPAAASEATKITDSPFEPKRPEPWMETFRPMSAKDIPPTMDSDAPFAVRRTTELPLAMARLARANFDAFSGEGLRVLVQYQEIEGVPFVGLVLAVFDEEGQAIDSLGWMLHIADSDDRHILAELRRDLHVRFGLYDEGGELVRGWEASLPLGANLSWIVERVEKRLHENAPHDAAVQQARQTFSSKDFPHIGMMRHNFHKDSFLEINAPSEAKLAVGIVNYWSRGEVFDYLIGNRAFSLDHFREIQRRVVTAALEWGIALPEVLRDFAIEENFASSLANLTQSLVATFAEVSVGVRHNDLDPLEEWENWEGLIELAQQSAVQPEPEVLELAEVALKRAQDFQENQDEVDDYDEANIANAGEIIEEYLEIGESSLLEFDMSLIDVDSLVVSKRSESTGVTYFLPDESLLDSFEDLSEMSREDLELFLDDANGRLEAAQMLIERFEQEAVGTVLAASEQMSVAEVVALAKFFESKADTVEAELVRCLSSVGPSATYIIARTLAASRNSVALPALLEAFLDPKRRGNADALARALSRFSASLLPPLTRALKKTPEDEYLILLLTCVEDVRKGTIAELSRDRSKPLREAAKLAMKKIETRGASV